MKNKTFIESHEETLLQHPIQTHRMRQKQQNTQIIKKVRVLEKNQAENKF